jgi:hypothetical protein
MKQGVIAGLFYFAVVFVVAFMLGALRTIYVVPLVGQSLAIAIELPIILTLAWHACRWFMIKCSVETWQDRSTMASLAFGLLIIAEWTTRFVFNRFILGDPTLPPIIATQTFTDGLGIAGQVAFGLLPFIMRTDSPQEMWPRPPTR